MNSNTLTILSAALALGGGLSLRQKSEPRKKKLPLNQDELEKLNSLNDRKEKRKFVQEMNEKYNE